MKFQICVGNPPYSKNLHLKIINTVINHLTEDGTASFIHPARWLQDPLAEYKSGTDKVKFKNIVDRLDDVKIIDTKTANTKFGILSNSELMLSKLKQKPTGKNITVYNEIAQEAIDIILKYSLEQNLSNVDEKNKVDGWRCQILDVIPIGRPNDDSNRLISNDLFHGIKNVVFYDGKDETGIEWMKLRNKNQYTKESGSPFPHSIKFKSKEEALNFQESCRTKFYNNIMYLFKLDMQTPFKFLPWMEDYSHTWTDEDYCKFFAKYGMSEECQKWMCRDVYDYRIKDFVDYEKFDDSKSEESVEPDSTPSHSELSKPIVDDEDKLIEKLKTMGKFQVICGNPPYQGKGDPLYMQITKAAYDTVLDEDGVMCMINPTTLVDNKFEGNDTYETLKKKYSDCKLSNFIYEKGIMGVFTSVEVGNDLGIFYYSKNGEHTLFDDWTKQIRFGDEYFKDRDIIKSIKSLNFDTIGKYKSFKNVQFGNTQKTKITKTKYIKTLPIGHNYVVCSFIRGHRDKNTGDRKWDWTTLMNSDWFIVQNKLPYMSMNFVDFDDDKQSAINLIKWINTDFIQYLVLYYKASISNSSVLFENLPQPPESGDFSDESLMKEFELTEDQMKHIHKKMKLFGWKTKEELIPDHKESSLLQFIDDLNNGKAKLPESKKGKKKESDSSPSGSEPSKTVLDN